MSAATIPHASEPGVLRFHQAVKLQFRFLWLSRRPLKQLAVMATVAYLAGELAPSPAAHVFVIVMLSAFLAGPTWAFVVWIEEPPSARHYLWSQSADRMHQSLARVMAGLLWLWAMLSVILTISVAIAAVGGHLAALPTISFAKWVSLFVGPTIGYVILSCLTVAFELPYWWMLGLVVLIWVRAIIFEGLGDFSLSSVLYGPWARISVGPQWWIAWPLWGIALSLLLYALARVHPDWFAKWPARILRRSPDA